MSQRVRCARSAAALLAVAVAVVSCDAPNGDVANEHPVRLVRPPVAPLSAMAVLGREIFHDSSLSASGRRSCASCHRSENAYAAADRSNITVADTAGTHGIVRAIPSLRYAYRSPDFSIGPELSDADAAATARRPPPSPGAPSAKVAGGAGRGDAMVARGGLFWDGRVNTLQDQAMGPLFNPSEMANKDVAAVSAKLRRAPYAQQFVTLFGIQILSARARLVDEAMFAVARYQIEDPSFHPYSSKYDAYLEGKATLAAGEWRGLRAFDDERRGNCAACHLDRAGTDGLPPTFTDYEYEALGVPRDTTMARSARHTFDLGACGPLRVDLRDQKQYCGMFRTPSLRNTATRSAFFHNGVYRTLDEVLAFYNFRDTRPELIYPTRPGVGVEKFNDLPAEYRGNIDTVDAPFDRKRGQAPSLTDQEMRDIVSFFADAHRRVSATSAPVRVEHSWAHTRFVSQYRVRRRYQSRGARLAIFADTPRANHVHPPLHPRRGRQCGRSKRTRYQRRRTRRALVRTRFRLVRTNYRVVRRPIRLGPHTVPRGPQTVPPWSAHRSAPSADRSAWSAHRSASSADRSALVRTPFRPRTHTVPRGPHTVPPSHAHRSAWSACRSAPARTPFRVVRRPFRLVHAPFRVVRTPFRPRTVTPGSVPLTKTDVSVAARARTATFTDFTPTFITFLREESPMRSRQSRVTDTVSRVQGFLDRHAPRLGTVNQTGTRRSLDEVAERIGVHATDQATGQMAQRGETQRQRALRLALRTDHLHPIAAIARDNLAEVPNFKALLLPDRHLKGHRLVAAVNAMGEEARHHAAVFVDAGLSPDFADAVLAATDDLVRSLGLRATSHGQQVRGTAGLAADVKRARRLIRVLHTLVVREIGPDDALRAEWESLSHVDRKPGAAAGRGAVLEIAA